jgi:hypothetical protein
MIMVRMVLKAAMTALFLLSCGLADDAWGGSTQTYLSLGDSLGFGDTVATHSESLGLYSDPSNGDRAFVAMYANYLGSLYGTRPNVINLAVYGETTSSFITGMGRLGSGPNSGITDATLADLNTNYTGLTPPSQASLLTSTLASEAAAHQVIGNITISLGSDDLFHLVSTNPNPTAADLNATLTTLASNYASILTTIRASLPNANIYLLSSYNPYTAAPSLPLAGLAGLVVPLLNQEIAAVAQEFHANYVDLYDTPLTNEAGRYTLILGKGQFNQLGNVHPNYDLGYRVIASAIESVPEPSSVVLLTLGTGIVGLASWSVASRRRRTVS